MPKTAGGGDEAAGGASSFAEGVRKRTQEQADRTAEAVVKFKQGKVGAQHSFLR